MSYRDRGVGITGHSDAVVAAGSGRAPRLIDQVRERIRVKHYSLKTEAAYCGWIRRFILANGKRHPRDMGGPDVEGFLSRLAVEGDVAASTQNQALAALLFLYREVLGQELPWMASVVRAKRPARCCRSSCETPCARPWRALATHAADFRAGFGAVFLPHALARKYPNAAQESVW